jgi:3-oxoacyl-[acyl-carrier protein] reductase
MSTHVKKLFDLSGKTALVTGGSRGLGLQIAEALGEAGARVMLSSRKAGDLEESAAQLKKRDIDAIWVAADASQPSEIVRVAEDAMARLGHVDILVNNAGSSQSHPFEAVSDADWQDDIDLKLFAAIRLTRLAWPHMQARLWGRIINVLNIGAKAPRAASAPTSVTRAAGMALTKVLAGEGAPHGILVNALLVGFIESDQWVQRAAKANVPLADFLANMGKEIPMGRVGTAQEFANAACFLASDAASYITGTAINVDGDRSPVV